MKVSEPCLKYKCKKIILKLNNNQKKIVDKWLDAYQDMYNISLKYIKNNINVKNILNFENLRSKLYD